MTSTANLPEIIEAGGKLGRNFDFFFLNLSLSASSPHALRLSLRIIAVSYLVVCCCSWCRVLSIRPSNISLTGHSSSCCSFSFCWLLAPLPSAIRCETFPFAAQSQAGNLHPYSYTLTPTHLSIALLIFIPQAIIARTASTDTPTSISGWRQREIIAQTTKLTDQAHGVLRTTLPFCQHNGRYSFRAECRRRGCHRIRPDLDMARPASTRRAGCACLARQ